MFLSTHIPNLATLAEPLCKLTREDVTFVWLKKHEDAFQSIKSNLVTKALAYFNVNWNTEVTVDASPVGLGALLTQTNPENLKEKNHVTCKSRILSETECRYSQIEKEGLACVWSLEALALYLLNHHF